MMKIHHPAMDLRRFSCQAMYPRTVAAAGELAWWAKMTWTVSEMLTSVQFPSIASPDPFDPFDLLHRILCDLYGIGSMALSRAVDHQRKVWGGHLKDTHTAGTDSVADCC